MIRVQGNKGMADFELATYLERIITDIVAQMYDECGIDIGNTNGDYYLLAYTEFIRRNYGYACNIFGLFTGKSTVLY